MLLSDYGKHVLLPEKDFRDFKPPEPSIPKSLGHHAEWIHACKTGAPTTCNFEYAGRLTEANHLGNVAYRAGKTLEWDAGHDARHATPPRPTGSSAASTARAGRWRDISYRRADPMRAVHTRDVPGKRGQRLC